MNDAVIYLRITYKSGMVMTLLTFSMAELDEEISSIQSIEVIEKV